MALGFVGAGSFALAFWQRPGMGDERHEDRSPRRPAGSSPRWRPCSRSIDLGAVQGAQYSGYLGRWARRSPCSTALGLELRGSLSASGSASVRGVGVGDAATAGRVPRPAARRGRTLIVRGLLPAQPVHGHLHRPDEPDPCWAMPCCPGCSSLVHNGVRGASRWRDWRAWWWAAVFALVLTSIGGGINAAVVADARRPACALSCTSRSWARAPAGRRAFLVRVGVLGTAGVAVVARTAGRARPLRDRLPSVHRAAPLNLGHEHPRRCA